MIRSRFSLLGVLVAAIGLTALFASAAQAEPGARWLVLKEAGVLLTHAQILEKLTRFEVVELENKTGTLLSEIATTKIEVLCTALELIDALLSETGVKNGAKIKFTGCKFYSIVEGLLKEQPKCEPKTNKGALGTVETLPFHGLLKLHKLVSDGKVDDTLLLLPDDEVNEHAATLELGASCAFGEELPIFGLLSLQDCGGTEKWLKHELSHLVIEFPALSDLSLFAKKGQAGAKPATIDGSATVKLNTDELYSGDPA